MSELTTDLIRVPDPEDGESHDVLTPEDVAAVAAAGHARDLAPAHQQHDVLCYILYSYIMVTFLSDKRSYIAFKKNKCCLRTLLVKTRVQESIRFSCELKLFDFRLETRFMKSNAHTQKSSLLSACLPFRETIG